MAGGNTWVGQGQRARRLAAAILGVAACALAGASVADAAAAPFGALSQLPGTAGCISADGASERGPSTCAVGRGLDGVESVTVSADGRFVYAASYKSGHEAGLSVFARDPLTGALSQLAGTAGCLTADGASLAGAGTCAVARGFEEPGDGHDVAITPDGRFLYLAAQNNFTPGTSILIFARNPATGALAQLPGTEGCISRLGFSGQCTVNALLDGAAGLTLSSDGRFLYATGDGNATGPGRVLAFSVNAASGALTQIQCLAQGAVAGCSEGRVLGDEKALTISADGTHAYGADYAFGLSIFDRDPATGLLTQKPGTAGCVTGTGLEEAKKVTCAAGRVLAGSYQPVLSADGRFLYSFGSNQHGLAVFAVAADGTLSQLPGTAGCITTTGLDGAEPPAACGTSRDTESLYATAISPDGLSLYEANDETEPGGLAVFSLAGDAPVQLTGIAGCLTVNGAIGSMPGVCTSATGIGDAYAAQVSPDGANLYLASYELGKSKEGAIAVFSRETGPTCTASAASTTFLAAVKVTLACSDRTGNPITWQITSSPAHGTLSGFDAAHGTVTYTPAPGTVGADTFTFTASEGTTTAAPASATVTVAGASPAIGSPTESHSRWRVGRKLAAISRRRRPPVGTAFGFTLNEPAAVKLTFLRLLGGRRQGHSCAAPSHRNRHGRRCVRAVAVGTVSLTGHAGANTVSFQGRLSSSKTLARGDYRVAIGASAYGYAAAPQELAFTIVG